MNTIRIAIVDDHNIFREGIRLVLQQIPHFEVIFDTGKGSELLAFLNKQTPDIILMDINMSEMQGDEVTELALEKNPDLKIIALTMFSDLTHYTQMIQAGVQGFIIKKASKKELQNAIETVFYGGHYFSDEILKKLAVQSIHNRSFFKEQLTEREKQILQLMCEGKTTVEISGILFISNKTVETHRTHIFKKAKVRNIAELVVWAIKNNYFSI